MIDLYDGSSAVGYPMGTLDVPSIAAFTGAGNIRFDFIVGDSIGSSKGLEASHDLYIEIEGALLSGEKKKLRTIISGSKGNSHLTAVGIYLITENILGLNGQFAQKTGGLYLPETIVSTDNIISRLKEFGINIIEEIIFKLSIKIHFNKTFLYENIIDHYPTISCNIQYCCTNKK